MGIGRIHRDPYRIVALALLLVSLAAVGGLAFAGGRYYRLPLEERIRAPEHADWKPAGRIGRRLGWIGTGLMVLNLAYMARRRSRFLAGVGSQRAWLGAHVFCGLTGPAILVFHSAFLTRNLVARVTVASTALLVIAGVVGRYLYAQLPRDIAGNELSLATLEAERLALLDEAGPLLPPGEAALLDALRTPAAPSEREATLVDAPGLVLGSLREDILRLVESLRLARRLRRAGVPLAEASRVASLVRRLAALRLGTRNLVVARRVLSLWREVHVKLAAVMVACVVIHIAVVAALGYAVW